MGARSWLYFVPYRNDIQAALDELKAVELAAGRYYPIIPSAMGSAKMAKRARTRHATIDAARQAACEEGTRSILDIDVVGTTPRAGQMVAISPRKLLALFGTTQPTRAQVEANQDFFEEIGRGHAIYILLYVDRKPTEICFAGMSFD